MTPTDAPRRHPASPGSRAGRELLGSGKPWDSLKRGDSRPGGGSGTPNAGPPTLEAPPASLDGPGAAGPGVSEHPESSMLGFCFLKDKLQNPARWVLEHSGGRFQNSPEVQGPVE